MRGLKAYTERTTYSYSVWKNLSKMYTYWGSLLGIQRQSQDFVLLTTPSDQYSNYCSQAYGGAIISPWPPWEPSLKCSLRAHLNSAFCCSRIMAPTVWSAATLLQLARRNPSERTRDRHLLRLHEKNQAYALVQKRLGAFLHLGH